MPVAVATTRPESVVISPLRWATFWPRFTTFPVEIILSPGLAAEMKDTFKLVVAHHSAFGNIETSDPPNAISSIKV